MYMCKFFKITVVILFLLFPNSIVYAQSQRDVHPNPIWKCISLEKYMPKKYELKIYRRKGDKRFQFVLVQTKPKKIILADITGEMEKDPSGQIPSKTLPSKLFFSFSIDKSKSVENGYLSNFVFDNSYEKRNAFKFTYEDPLQMGCLATDAN